jgi:hypothetical protein
MRYQQQTRKAHASIREISIYTRGLFDRLSDTGYHFASMGIIGKRLLSKRLEFSTFVISGLHTSIIAAGRLFAMVQHPWVDNRPAFPKIGCLAARVGYICWDFLSRRRVSELVRQAC